MVFITCSRQTRAAPRLPGAPPAPFLPKWRRTALWQFGQQVGGCTRVHLLDDVAIFFVELFKERFCSLGSTSSRVSAATSSSSEVSGHRPALREHAIAPGREILKGAVQLFHETRPRGARGGRRLRHELSGDRRTLRSSSWRRAPIGSEAPANARAFDMSVAVARMSWSPSAVRYAATRSPSRGPASWWQTRIA